MTDYQIYVLTGDERICGAPAILACGGDQEAIQKAELLVSDHAIELWAGVRFVMRRERRQ